MACVRHGKPTFRVCGRSAKVEIPDGTNSEELIKVPENAQYFAVLGSVEFGKEEELTIGRYLGTESLSTTSTTAAQKKRRPLVAKVSLRKTLNLLLSSRPMQRRNLTRQRFIRGKRLLVSLELTQDRLPQRPLYSTKRGRFCARPTSFRMGIRFRIRSKCLRSFESRSR